MNPFKYSLSLRLTHPVLKAVEIEDALSLKARVSQSVGDQRKTPKSILLEGSNKHTYCTFALSDGDDAKLDSEINYWNVRLSEHAQFLKTFTDTGGKAEYFLGLFLSRNAGFEFSSDELRGMQNLGISLALDIYPHT